MKKDNLEEEFPSNSKSKRIVPMRESRRTNKEEETEVEPKRARRAIKAHAVRRKKTMFQSIAEALVGDGSNNVGSYVLNDVLLPAAKNTIQEMITTGLEMLLFGEARGGHSRGRDRDRTVVSYGKYYKDKERGRDRPSYRDRFDLDEIFFNNQSEAEDVLDELCELLEEYEQVTVADYFELAGIDGASWAHNKYGWEDLRKAYHTHTRNGYVIVLPKPIELD